MGFLCGGVCVVGLASPGPVSLARWASEQGLCGSVFPHTENLHAGRPQPKDKSSKPGQDSSAGHPGTSQQARRQARMTGGRGSR